MADLRIGLAGLGIHGRRYADHLLAGDIPGARLAAVARRNEAEGRALAAAHGLRYHRDAADLAADPDLDAVILVVPPDLHLALCEAALSRGRPVLVEKPLATTAAAARAIAEHQEATGVPLMVGHTLRFDPLVARLREESPALGPLRVAAINQRFEPTSRPWIDTPGRGGAVLNTGVHGLDLLRVLTGAEAVSVQALTLAAVTRETEDTFGAVLRMEPGGILATLDNARTTAGRSGRIEIAGRDGQLAGDHVRRTLVRVAAGGAVDLGPIPPVPTVREVLRAFVGALRSGTPMPVPAREGAAAVAMAEAILESARTGRRVDL